MSTNSKGLSFVFIEPGNKMTEEEHYDWYDNEHSPARLTVPGFFTAIRYKAADFQKPSYLTLYDMSEPSVANGPDFQVLRERASTRDNEMLERVQYLNRRTYELIEEPYVRDGVEPSSFPGKFILLAGAEVKPEIEDDFNKWYREEHVVYLQKFPGWLRCRRYKLFDNLNKGVLEGVGTLKVCKYLAIHEFSEDGFMESEVFKGSVETSWVRQIATGVTNQEVRYLRLHRIYQKPKTVEQ
ncbi:alpha beta [Moniliophthora roreri MCA 2997]|uniref:Alpha beta n=1 Tax=Moniliophthora roreri (strain MCA 2997) TaxID=1381753 RepID=V2WVL6_MONRO|nr:alpha beta [Moniliophthora roreri MCA 2997]